MELEGSFIKIERERLKALCEKTLDRVKSYRVKREQEWIEAETIRINERAHSFLGVLFRLETTTPEKVLAKAEVELAKAQGWMHPLDRIRSSGACAEDTAMQLLKALEHSDAVFVSLSDLDTISSWISGRVS